MGKRSAEARFPPSTQAEMRARGHDLAVVEPWALGCVCAVRLRDEWMRGAATPRQMHAYAIGHQTGLNRGLSTINRNFRGVSPCLRLPLGSNGCRYPAFTASF
jgi:hypothetical protein